MNLQKYLRRTTYTHTYDFLVPDFMNHVNMIPAPASVSMITSTAERTICESKCASNTKQKYITRHTITINNQNNKVRTGATEKKNHITTV